MMQMQHANQPIPKNLPFHPESNKLTPPMLEVFMVLNEKGVGKRAREGGNGRGKGQE